MSSSKRSKIVRSSSQGEIGLFSHAQPIEPLETQWVPKRSDYWETFQESTATNPNVEKTTMTGDRGKQKAQLSRGKSILMINSPPPEESNGSDKFRGFLKQCAWCKKIDFNADVFMYGDFGAFCSFKCRNFQISSDGYNIGNALDVTPTAQNGLQKNGNGNKIRSRNCS